MTQRTLGLLGDIGILPADRPHFDARVNLTVLSRRSAEAWLAESTSWRTLLFNPATVVLVADDFASGDLKRLSRSLPGRVWSVRESLGGDWRRFCESLLEAAFPAETDIEARFRLHPSNLLRSTIASYEQIAELFAERWFDHPPQHELDMFVRQLGPRSRVLDAGCGPGHHARIIRDAGHDVVGIDLSDGMLDQARRRAPSIHVLKMDLAELTFGAAEFDAIWCAAAILHIPREHLSRVLRGFARTLKPGGMLALNFQVGRQSELVQHGVDERFFEYYADASEVTQVLRSVGFSVANDLYGETPRNTHGLDMVLKWSTLYAMKLGSHFLDPRGAGQDRLAQA